MNVNFDIQEGFYVSDLHRELPSGFIYWGLGDFYFILNNIDALIVYSIPYKALKDLSGL